jgi:hypothetical protein
LRRPLGKVFVIDVLFSVVLLQQLHQLVVLQASQVLTSNATYDFLLVVRCLAKVFRL